MHGHRCYFMKCALGDDGKCSVPYEADKCEGCYTADVFKRYLSVCAVDGGERVAVEFCKLNAEYKVAESEKIFDLTQDIPVKLPAEKREQIAPAHAKPAPPIADGGDGGGGGEEDELAKELEAACCTLLIICYLQQCTAHV